MGFTSGFSQDSISITVGEQITVKQLIETSRQPMQLHGLDISIKYDITFAIFSIFFS